MFKLKPRMPEYQKKQCLQEACPYFDGEPCGSYETWFAAADKDGKRYHRKTPAREETGWIAYGHVCVRAAEQTYVANRIEVYGFDEIEYYEAESIVEEPDTPYEIRFIGDAATAIVRGKGGVSPD